MNENEWTKENKFSTKFSRIEQKIFTLAEIMNIGNDSNRISNCLV